MGIIFPSLLILCCLSERFMPCIHIPALPLPSPHRNPTVPSLLVCLLGVLLEHAQLMPEHNPFVWIHQQFCTQPACQAWPTVSHQSLPFSAGIPWTRCQMHIFRVLYGIHKETLTVWSGPQFSAACQNELFHFCTINARLGESILKNILHKTSGFHVLN